MGLGVYLTCTTLILKVIYMYIYACKNLPYDIEKL